LDVVNNKITPYDFNILNNDYIAKEVYEAIKDIKSNGAPGSDDLSALFYHQYWIIIGPNILEYALNILKNEGITANISHTLICLIPKINSHTLPYEFRPISLCNVIMKIITKTLANRVKLVLPNIINEYQSAFLPRILITDNSLIAFESFQYTNKTRKKNNGFVGIKFDIAKAYDNLEWDFIEEKKH